MQKDSKLFEDIAKMASGAAGAAMDMRREFESMIGDKIERLVSSGRFVAREEFEVVKAMAEKARAENETLKTELAKLKNNRVIMLHASSPVKNGFSLVELAIVLVILGLLVGGVLAGKSLIRAAELRSVTVEHQKYFMAIKAFREKYFALPGDMNNATRFWGAAGSPSTSITCQNVRNLNTTTSRATCDGDGNGKIDFGTIMEPMRLWQHLSNSGLISSVIYMGDPDDNGCVDYTRLGYAPTCPKAKIGNYWNIDYITGPTDPNEGFAVQYGNSMHIGYQFMDFNGIMNPSEVRNIDTKIDDGKPARGKVVVAALLNISRCTTTAVTTNFDADYYISSANTYADSKFCSLYYINQF